jgi:hypothetical protein
MNKLAPRLKAFRPTFDGSLSSRRTDMLRFYPDLQHSFRLLCLPEQRKVESELSKFYHPFDLKFFVD